jgi:hypothetical protein
MNQKGKLDAEYAILNVWNFTEGLGLRVEVEVFPTSSRWSTILSL